jgi:hypothetical protein
VSLSQTPSCQRYGPLRADLPDCCQQGKFAAAELAGFTAPFASF